MANNRKPKGSTVNNEFGNIGQRGTSQEKTILSQLKEMVKTDGKAYYIMFRVCPEMLPKYTEEHPIKTFEDLKAAYPGTIRADERICQNYMYEENVQKAIKWIYGKMHTQKMIEVYDKIYEKALSGDTQAVKTLSELGEKLFDTNSDSDLLKALHGVDVDGMDSDGSDEDFKIE